LQKESLEGRLSQEGASILKQTSELRVDDIQSALPVNAALIDYSVRWFSEPSEENPGAVTRRQALIAFVIRRGTPVAMYDLGPVEPIYAAIETWRATRGSSPVAKQAGVLLRERLWAPIEMAIGNARIALISPDGALGKFPFAALPGARPDTYLIEDLAVAVIPVPLLIPHLMDSAPTGELSRHMLVVGGVDYDHRPTAEGTMIAASPPVPTLPWEHRGGTPTLAGEFPPWEKKRGMAREATYIAGMYRQFMQLPDNSDKIIHLHDAEATEEAFCQMAPECKLLHLATHGYFVAGRGLGPGHTSGLVMGGANLPRPIPGDGDLSKMPGDGYLTAEEISFLSLSGTQLVVLSACDSGLGEIALGEGALGIQRAFQVAGARATIATLWKVHDGATRQIMEEFYTHYLQPDPQLHMSPLEALQAAQLWALYNPYEVFRGSDPPPDAGTVRRLPPEYWAAFTLSGDWR
jgi:CHAT domain-containing protein